MATALLAACAAPPPGPSAPVPSLDVRLSGAGLTVASGPGQRLGYDEGLGAKRAAEGFCAGRRQRLDPAALGRYSAGMWVFGGGCV